MEYLSQRAGLLLPRGVGVYTFPHRTFQEYLAACYLTDHDYPDRTAGLAREDTDRWREVALLAGAKAARGTASAIWSLVDALCYQEPGDETLGVAPQWGALLAGQALAESADLGDVSERNRPKLARVQNWLVRILELGELPALERASAGDTLAVLGDPRFDPERWYLPCDDTLGFARIPAGSFSMGSNPDRDEYSRDNEQPQHELHLPDYWISRYPTTVAQFRAFVEASGYEPRRRDSLEGVPNHPVVYVTWHDAIAYCRWLTTKLMENAEDMAVLSSREQERALWQGVAHGEWAADPAQRGRVGEGRPRGGRAHLPLGRRVRSRARQHLRERLAADQCCGQLPRR